MPGKYSPIWYPGTLSLYHYLNVEDPQHQILFNPLKISQVKLSFVGKGVNLSLSDGLGGSTAKSMDYYDLLITFKDGTNYQSKVMTLRGTPAATYIPDPSKTLVPGNALYNLVKVINVVGQVGSEYYDPRFNRTRKNQVYETYVDGVLVHRGENHGVMTPTYLFPHRMA